MASISGGSSSTVALNGVVAAEVIRRHLYCILANSSEAYGLGFRGLGLLNPPVFGGDCQVELGNFAVSAWGLVESRASCYNHMVAAFRFLSPESENFLEPKHKESMLDSHCCCCSSYCRFFDHYRACDGACAGRHLFYCGFSNASSATSGITGACCFLVCFDDDDDYCDCGHDWRCCRCQLRTRRRN